MVASKVALLGSNMVVWMERMKVEKLVENLAFLLDSLKVELWAMHLEIVMGLLMACKMVA